MRLLLGFRGLLGLPLAWCFAAAAVAQINPGDPGFYVRYVNSAATVNSQADALNVLSLGAINEIAEGNYEVIDFAGGGGTYGVNNPYPNGVADESIDDFVVQGWADVTIPAGQWGVGCGSDDGCLVEIAPLDGSPFEWNLGKFNENGANIPTNQIRYDGNRGHSWTFGGFELENDLEARLFVSMHERGGGDAFEVAYTDFAPFASDVPDDRNWFLLNSEDSKAFDIDWNVRVPDPVPSVAIPVAPGQQLNGVAGNVEKENVGEVLPGLLHYWYGRANPGNYEAVQAFYDFDAGPIEDPDIAPFNPEWTWWAGNQSAVTGGTTDVPKYPAEVIDQPRLDGSTFNSSDNSNYVTAVSGELLIPRDGEYIFSDGVDDLTVLAIDLDRSGDFSDDEFLINDNAWTSLNRDSNNGGFPNDYIPVTFDVPEDGNCDDPANASDLCWYRIEAVFGEGGGTDAGILYWNEREDIEFPAERDDGRIIADEDIPELAIPEDHLRAPGGVVITAADLTATLNADFDYEFEINEDGTFDSLTVNRSIDVANTIMDLNGATVNLIPNGDLSGLEGELRLFSADQLVGDVTVNVPEGLEVDTSRLASEGVLVFGMPMPGLAGDIDGDGTVGFPDFLILSANFGMAGGAADGDIDGDGQVGFPDFLILSGNFGQSAAAAAAVPEPSTLGLLGAGGFLLALARRRRR